MRSFLQIAALSTIIILLCCSGCSQHQQIKNSDTRQYQKIINATQIKEAWGNLVQNNRCGVLRFSPGNPVFNFSGYIRTTIRPNSSAYLFTTANTSFESAMYAVENCHPITRVPIDTNGNFIIESLPAGKYVVIAPSKIYYDTQGAPMVKEFNHSGHGLKIAFHGGDPYHSVVVFSIFGNE